MDASIHNFELPLDVDASGLVTPLDALQIVNHLNRRNVACSPEEILAGARYFDTSGDGRVSPIDVLLVVSAISKYRDSLYVIPNLAPDQDRNLNSVVTLDEVHFVGISLPNVKIAVILKGGAGDSEDAGSVEVTSDDRGRFGVSLHLNYGENLIEFRVRDPLGRTAHASRLISRGNLVHDWNAAVLNVVREWSDVSDDPYEGRIVPSEPPRVARNLAMVQTAMFDAVNAVEKSYVSYLPDSFMRQGPARADAAVAAAAFEVASHLYPDADEMAYWNATLAESLQVLPDDDATANGLELGRRVGQAMIKLRATDGADANSEYAPGNAPGRWKRTPPSYIPPLIPHWRHVRPFVVDEVADFRPESPPAIDSAQYASALDEVFRLGSLRSHERTQDQTEIAVFWADGAGTYTPPGHWNQIAADVSMSQGTGLIETARLFALLNLALADAGIAAWDAKYEFDLWRPIDAIREAASDGNPETVQDEDWLPLLPTPPFPTFTSGHSTFSGAADVVLTEFFGDHLAFSSRMDGQNAPGQRPLDPFRIVTRHFESFAEAAEEAGVSRIYGGIHFAFDNTAGLAAGRQVGSVVVNSALRPLTSS